jgi:hypothetical protein
MTRFSWRTRVRVCEGTPSLGRTTTTMSLDAKRFWSCSPVPADQPRTTISGTFTGTTPRISWSNYLAVGIQFGARYGIEMQEIGSEAIAERCGRSKSTKKHLTLRGKADINRMKLGGDTIESVSRKVCSLEHGQSSGWRREGAISLVGRVARGHERGAGSQILGRVAGHFIQVPFRGQDAGI